MTPDVAVAALWTVTFVCLPWLYDRIAARREHLTGNPRRATNEGESSG